ncbi:MAG: HalOD1 output domain-containing protein [Halobacteriaceae archaeon]
MESPRRQPSTVSTAAEDSDRWQVVAETRADIDSRDDLGVAVVRTLAHALDTDPEGLGPPLVGDRVDVATMQRLLDADTGSVLVTFRYEGYRVAVRSDGLVRVQERVD